MGEELMSERKIGHGSVHVSLCRNCCIVCDWKAIETEQPSDDRLMAAELAFVVGMTTVLGKTAHEGRCDLHLCKAHVRMFEAYMKLIAEDGLRTRAKSAVH